MRGLMKTAAITIIIGIFIYSGCILNPKEDVEPTPVGPQKEFRPLTEKENVIYNLVLSYERTNATYYEELLHADYIWYNQERDAEKYGAFYNRDKDLEIVRNMFDAANGRAKAGHPIIDRLYLKIPIFEPDSLNPNGRWNKIDTIPGGDSCDDCWETEREYEISVEVGGEEDMTYIGNDIVKFIIAPVIEDGVKKYKIIRAYDLPKAGG